MIEATQKALRSEMNAGRLCRVLLAYPCREYGARMFLIAADATAYSPAFEPYECVEYLCGGGGEPWAEVLTREPMTLERMSQFIDRQVLEPSETVFGWKGHTMGGNVIQLRVSAAGVRRRLVRENIGAVEAALSQNPNDRASGEANERD